MRNWMFVSDDVDMNGHAHHCGLMSYLNRCLKSLSTSFPIIVDWCAWGTSSSSVRWLCGWLRLILLFGRIRRAPMMSFNFVRGWSIKSIFDFGDRIDLLNFQYRIQARVRNKKKWLPWHWHERDILNVAHTLCQFLEENISWTSESYIIHT